MKNPEVSVIIPVYNGEKTLKQCLSSVLEQDYKDYEIIVVDNNSTDKTKEIIKDIQSKNKEVRYLFEPTQGEGAARNMGEKEASGEIILMTDSDCIVPNNWVKRMTRPLIDEEYDAVQGFKINRLNDFWNRYRQINSEEKFDATEKIGVIGNIDPRNFAIKKSSLEAIGRTSRKYISGNDVELSIRLAKNNLKIKYMKDVRVKHAYPASLKSVFRKYVYRARHVTIVVRDNRAYLQNSIFLKRTAQTPWSFIKFFPGLIKTALLRGFNYAYYDLITGLFWRIGLVSGWLLNRLNN